jgi:hypothetical protein
MRNLAVGVGRSGGRTLGRSAHRRSDKIVEWSGDAEVTVFAPSRRLISGKIDSTMSAVSSPYCPRCTQPLPQDEKAADWVIIDDGVEVVCPGCATPLEKLREELDSLDPLWFQRRSEP